MEIILFVLGVAIGAAINWGFARQSSRELRAEAERLRAETALVRQAVNVLGGAMDQAGWAKVAFDQGGNLTALQLVTSTSAHLSGAESATASAEAYLSSVDPPRPDRPDPPATSAE